MGTNRGWMYERILDDKTMSPVFINGVEEFFLVCFWKLNGGM
jgi:hypothetical protein